MRIIKCAHCRKALEAAAVAAENAREFEDYQPCRVARARAALDGTP